MSAACLAWAFASMIAIPPPVEVDLIGASVVVRESVAGPAESTAASVLIEEVREADRGPMAEIDTVAEWEGPGDRPDLEVG